MTVYETDVPGVGKKFELDIGGSARAVVLLHHDGRVELFRRDSPDADSEKLLDLTSQQSNHLGSILEGAYFQSVDLDEIAVPLGDAILEWVEVEEDARIVGTTLASCNVRANTGASIIAIQRDGETVPNPDPDTVIEAGDVFVSLGSREEQQALSKLVRETAD